MKSGGRQANEMLDTMIYCTAAAIKFGVNWLSDVTWNARSRRGWNRRFRSRAGSRRVRTVRQKIISPPHRPRQPPRAGSDHEEEDGDPQSDYDWFVELTGGERHNGAFPVGPYDRVRPATPTEQVIFYAGRSPEFFFWVSVTWKCSEIFWRYFEADDVDPDDAAKAYVARLDILRVTRERTAPPRSRRDGRGGAMGD